MNYEGDSFLLFSVQKTSSGDRFFFFIERMKHTVVLLLQEIIALYYFYGLNKNSYFNPQERMLEVEKASKKAFSSRQ